MGQQPLHSRYPLAQLHKDEEVAKAIQNLVDRLCQYERSTGLSYLVAVMPLDEDGIPVCSLDGPIAPIDALRIAQELPHAFSTENHLERHAHGRS